MEERDMKKTKRRDFLKLAGMGIAATSLPQIGGASKAGSLERSVKSDTFYSGNGFLHFP